MRHEPWYREDRHVDPLVGIALGRTTLGFVNAGEQPVRNEDGSLLAVMDGEVYNAAELRRGLVTDHDFRTDSQAELLIHGYEARGRDFFRGLEGKFVAAIWDSRAHKLIATCDRFGMRPLYYQAERPGKLLLASEIKALLVDPEIPRKVHVRGLAQFFTYGQLLGEDTLLEGIRLLPAAGWLVYDGRSGCLTLDRYWRLEVDRKPDGAATPALLERIDEAFQGAVDRCTAGPHRLGLSLSAGLDSRTILAAIDRDRLPIPTVTLGIEGSIDHRGSRRLAELAGCPHRSVILDEGFLSRFEEHLARMVHLTDGQYYSDCITMPTLSVYQELGIEVLIRGHAGELMHMHKAYSFSVNREALALRDDADLEAWLLRRLRAYYQIRSASGPLFAEPYGSQIEPLSRESLRDCLDESAGVDPLIHRVWHMFVSQRLRRETALSMVEFGSVVETRVPYLNSMLIDALLATPPEWKLSDRIQAQLLRRRKPEFLDVMNANTGTRVGVGRLERLFGRARLKVLNKLRVRGYQHYERMAHWLRTDLRPLVDDLLLSERASDRGIFNPHAVRDIVRQHLEGQGNNTFLLVSLMIFEQGQREFIDGDGYRGGTKAVPAVHRVNQSS
jgi:asparagine synthase (glutamine-hydrolysing)